MRRLNASTKAAERYMQQFPSPVLSEAAKCVAFVAGSFAAWVLFMAALSDVVLERPLFGHTLVWCAACSLCMVWHCMMCELP